MIYFRVLQIISLLTTVSLIDAGVRSPNEVPGDLLFGGPYDTRAIVPGEYCDRECTDNTPSYRCYYSFVIEDFSILGGACEFCEPPNEYHSAINNCTCIIADGVERTFLSVNRALPSPLLRGCVGDMMIIDAKNNFEGGATTIHWHGILQRRTPWSDGVPFVTQCPIIFGSTYRYYFDLEDPGTYFYHSHAGLDKYNGEAGALVVRQNKKNEKCGDMYDRDETVFFLQDWLHESPKDRFPGRRVTLIGNEPESMLINGHGIYIDEEGNESNAPLAHFYIQPGEKLRFRMVNAFSSSCAVIVTIQNHTLTVVEKDSSGIQPVTVDSILCMTGERFDFIVEGNMEPGDYWIQVRGSYVCTQNLMQWGVLHYDKNSMNLPKTPRPSPNNTLPMGRVINWDRYCNDTYICMSQLHSDSDHFLPELLDEEIEQIFLPFQTNALDAESFYEANNFMKFMSLGPAGLPFVASMRNISFSLPASPLLTQYEDIPQDKICYNCSTEKQDSEPCYCTGIIKMEPCKTYEIIIVDNKPPPTALHHPIHIHGYFFAVVAQGFLMDLNIGEGNYTQEAFLEADRAGLVKRNLEYSNPPAVMDTIIMPPYGYVVARLYTDNLGFWFVHCHILTHIVVGMETVFQVGEVADMLPIPEGMPKCGNFIPTDITGGAIDYCPYVDNIYNYFYKPYYKPYY